MQRDTQSKFLDDLTVSKRGMVKVASSQVPKGKDATTKHDVNKVLKTFEKSPDVSKKTLTQYQQRNELDQNSKQVAQDFFKDLGDARKHKKQMHLITAMSLRQAGIFKMAGRDVYEDLETGDFWKMSEDKKHVMRLFKENEKGISDKKATILTADTEDKYYEVSYEDATGRKGSISLFAESPEDAKNNVEDMLKASVGGKTLQVQTTNAPQIASSLSKIEKEALKSVVDKDTFEQATLIVKEIDNFVLDDGLINPPKNIIDAFKRVQKDWFIVYDFLTSLSKTI